MDNIKKLINLNLLNVVYKIKHKENISLNNEVKNYINNNLINLIDNNNINNNNNLKEILYYLLNNDGNFLLVNKNLKEVENFIKKKYNLETNKEELNNIIIEYLEKDIKI